MRILIVEDDEVAALIYEQALSSYGECIVVHDAEQALATFLTALDSTELDSTDRIGLICLDLLLPQMSGHEFLSQIRVHEKERNIPDHECVKVIITSGLRDKANLLSAYREGCEAYLVKPFEREELIDAVKKLGIM